MGDFEEALRNIDVFCKVLVEKMIKGESEWDKGVVVEPMENLLQRKYIIEEHLESSPLSRHLIPLPQVEEPLIDVFEENNYVRILVQCRCKDQKVTVHTDMESIEICKKECHKDDSGTEICTDKCQKLNLPVKNLQFENMIAKCSNNTVLELEIPKRYSN